MSTFKKYANYYNIFYADKDYKTEVKYIDRLTSEYKSKSSKSLLNIGCGTGNHDKYFSELGYNIDAFDLSQEMIEIAKEQKIENTNFFVSDIKSFDSKKKYDVIVSLFHVLSYQTTNESLDDFFKLVSDSLDDGGLCVADCWYGVGVLKDPPTVRVKDFQTDEKNIIRIAEPKMISKENTVEVNYRLIVTDKKTGISDEITEQHKMRYVFIPEIEFFANKNNLEVVFVKEWMKDHAPTDDCWNICFALKKAGE